MKIGPRTVVTFHYTLTSDAGDVLDSSRGGEPLSFLQGAGDIVPGLEKAMDGREPGDSYKVCIAPEDGYGPRVEGLVQQAQRAMFEGQPDPQVGMQFQAESNMGPVQVLVVAVDGDSVTLDGNHPLAGTNLNFDIEVVGVREASVDEVLHGHVHGAGGHHH